MIDNAAEVAKLISEMQAQLPIPVKVTPEVIRAISNKITLAPDQVIQILEVIYLGDEGGIACHLSLPEDGVNFVSSLTHLRIKKDHPLARKIIAYQTKRSKRLERNAKKQGRFPYSLKQ